MKLYVDCEFNGYQGELISMALVDENGREWYEVLGCDHPVEWVAANVMPVLNKTSVPLEYFQKSLEEFLAEYFIIDVIADWPEDISHFCKALITGPGTRINTPILRMHVIRSLNSNASNLPHNAAADAHAIRAMDLDLEDD